jgi:hypothetical protein
LPVRAWQYLPASTRAAVVGPRASVSVCDAIMVRNSIDALEPVVSFLPFGIESIRSSCSSVVMGGDAEYSQLCPSVPGHA